MEHFVYTEGVGRSSLSPPKAVELHRFGGAPLVPPNFLIERALAAVLVCDFTTVV